MTFRAFGDSLPPVSDLTAINSVAKDVPRAPGQHGLVMPLGSERETPGAYQTFLATRAGRRSEQRRRRRDPWLSPDGTRLSTFG